MSRMFSLRNMAPLSTRVEARHSRRRCRIEHSMDGRTRHHGVIPAAALSEVTTVFTQSLVIDVDLSGYLLRRTNAVN